MSWSSNREIIRRFETEAERGTLTLESLLKDDCFLNALGQHPEHLSSFVAKNVPTLIKYAIHLEDAPSGVDPNRCQKALVSHNSKLIDALINDVNVVTLLTQSITEDIYYPNYFKILQFAIDSDFLKKIPDPDVFFQNLVNKISNQNVFQFLTNLRNHNDWLLKVNADQKLMLKIYDDEYTVSCVLRLIVWILEGAENNELIQRLSSPENFKLIFETGIDAPTYDISEKAFKILSLLLRLCDSETPTNSSELTQYDKIAAYLHENVHKLCDFVLKNDEFFGDKRYAVELIHDDVEISRKCLKCVAEVLKLLFETFFKQPTNTFLHGSFSLLFEAILDLTKDDWLPIVQDLKIMQKMIEEHKNVNVVTINYHGFIIKISKSIHQTLKNAEVEIPEDFELFIKEVVDPTLERYETNYGGTVPREETLNAHFIESRTIVDDDFEDVQDPNDNSEEEEEEG